MNETEVIYIALGLAVSLLFAELLGVAPGGIIVPGYLALSMQEPLRVVVTLAIGFLTFFVVRAAYVAIERARARLFRARSAEVGAFPVAGAR